MDAALHSSASLLCSSAEAVHGGLSGLQHLSHFEWASFLTQGSVLCCPGNSAQRQRWLISCFSVLSFFFLVSFLLVCNHTVLAVVVNQTKE